MLWGEFFLEKFTDIRKKKVHVYSFQRCRITRKSKIELCSYRNDPCRPPHGRSMEIPRGGGVGDESIDLIGISRGMVGGGEWCKPKNFPWGMWIFSGTRHCIELFTTRKERVLLKGRFYNRLLSKYQKSV